MAQQIRVDDFVGSSSESWSDAARNAVSQMAGMADSIQGVDVLSQSAEVENQEIIEYRTTVRVAYTPSSKASGTLMRPGASSEAPASLPIVG
jgi:flavin-binding protein dodecin